MHLHKILARQAYSCSNSSTYISTHTYTFDTFLSVLTSHIVKDIAIYLEL